MDGDAAVQAVHGPELEHSDKTWQGSRARQAPKLASAQTRETTKMAGRPLRSGARTRGCRHRSLETARLGSAGGGHASRAGIAASTRGTPLMSLPRQFARRTRRTCSKADARGSVAGMCWMRALAVNHLLNDCGMLTADSSTVAILIGADGSVFCGGMDWTEPVRRRHLPLVPPKLGHRGRCRVLAISAVGSDRKCARRCCGSGSALG
jgi:hypothetical protein